MADSSVVQARTLVFVYGTLKKGFTNHTRYLADAEANGGARFLHLGTSTQSFALVVRPKHMMPPTCGPVMMESPNDDSDTHCIPGEIYEVSHEVLQGLDILEGVRSGCYYHKSIDVLVPEEGTPQTTTLQCIVYLYPANAELLALPRLASYSAREHAAYDPPAELNPEILRLCKTPGHGLRTAKPCPVRVHCLRLLPGEDVLASLKAFVAEVGIGAASVLSAVGSTGQTALRPAGLPKARLFDGKFEVVSLSGTLGPAGHHLHMSISDAECHVYGGHVMPGCLVRTTLEVVVAEIDGVDFERPRDARTGYDELSILPSAWSRSGRKRARPDASP